MNWFIKTFQSSIGQKWIMALTGLFLSTFLIVHMIGNLQLFKHDDGLAFNHYAAVMTTNPLIKTVSYVLYTLLLVHVFKGFNLVFRNKASRPVRYEVVNGAANSHWTSRNMGLLGTILLAFIILHLQNFWFEYKFGHVPYHRYTFDLVTGKQLDSSPMPAEFTMDKKYEEVIVPSQTGISRIIIVKDLYAEVKEEFKEMWLVLVYVLCMFSVSFHLIHGFKSAFQSLGLNHAKYNGVFRFLGIYFFGIIIPVSFALMPLYFYFTK